jgi:ankyrin repeat protein
MLLVRSGTGIPNWISPMECQKLAVGTSFFECCEKNHTVIEQCRRSICLVILDRMLKKRTHSLFASKNYAESRFSLCFRNYWCRGLIDDNSRVSWKSQSHFKSDLQWSDTVDGKWLDRENIPLLAYAVTSGCSQVVREVLEEILKISDPKRRFSCLHARIPKQGVPRLGITRGCPVSLLAMITLQPETISLLLDSGFDPQETDLSGNDAFMSACMSGNTDNVKLWLNRFPKWNLEKKNKVVGGVALSHTVYMGPNRYDLVKLLLDHGALVDYRTHTGGSVLTAVCANEDGEPEVLELLLKQKTMVNYQIRSRNTRWRNIHRISRLLYRYKLSSSGLVRNLARKTGMTALHCAAKRGDVDIVNLLLQYGADPSIKNVLGETAIDFSSDFPEIRGGLKRVAYQREVRMSASLHRRDTTASDLKFPMYLVRFVVVVVVVVCEVLKYSVLLPSLSFSQAHLIHFLLHSQIPLEQLQRIYGGKIPRKRCIEAHQELKRQQELVRWEDLPFDASIIFVSHEWIGWSHPDPHGIQLKTFLSAMNRLYSGEIDRVEMSVGHVLMYKKNHIVRSREWEDILTSSYVWFDWGSMPQPSACPPGVAEEKKKTMDTNLRKAVKSIPAYVERADFVVIVAPGCLHADRRDPETGLREKTCYRTYRSRGWCVLEIFASYLSRDKIHPILLVTSKNGNPEWLSSVDVLFLAVGTSMFTCCQRNHIFGEKLVPCDRGITKNILQTMINAKIAHLARDRHNVRVRFYFCLANWWLRTGSIPQTNNSKSIEVFKSLLLWDERDDEWTDCENIPILFYAVVRNEIEITRSLLKSEIYPTNILNAMISLHQHSEEFGLSSQMSILHVAVSFASVQIVQMLLESGLNSQVTDNTGNDSFMIACALGRVQNIQFWLSRFPEWNLNRGNSINQAAAIHYAVFVGRKKLKTVQILVESGRVNLDALNGGGASVLMNAVANKDSDADVIKYLLSQKLRYGVNYRRKAQTIKWKCIYGLARGLSRLRLARSGLFIDLASYSGSTTLQWATQRGDIEIVEILMEHGAKPLIKNSLGRNALSYCKPFPEIKSAIKRVERQNGGFKHSSSGYFTLQRRLSTATPVMYDMYLLNLDTIFKLYGKDGNRETNADFCHQELLERDDLIRFEDLPMGAFVMFISHQWSGFDHPDPNGHHMKVLLKMLWDLRDGRYSVETETFHVLVYKQNTITSSSEWKHLLSNAYIWYDWFSQPQPSRGKNTVEVTVLSRDLNLALDSVPAYVERADILVILAPTCVHADKIDQRTSRKRYLCYRTWRKRGYCVLEFFCANLSRRSTHPVLLCQSVCWSA